MGCSSNDVSGCMRPRALFSFPTESYTRQNKRQKKTKTRVITVFFTYASVQIFFPIHYRAYFYRVPYRVHDKIFMSETQSFGLSEPRTILSVVPPDNSSDLL